MNSIVITLVSVITIGFRSTGVPIADVDGWGAPFNLSDDGITQYMGYGYQHTVATDTGGNVHVVWYDNRTGTNQIFYRRWSRYSGTWDTITRLTNQSVAVYRPAVACDYTGNVHIVWYQSTSPYYGIWYKKWNVATGSWGDSVYLYNPGGNYLNYYPSIACRPGGDNVHVVWYGRDPANPVYFRIKHVEYNPGVGWGSVTLVDSAPSDSNLQASVAVDEADSVYVVWRKKVAGYWQVFYRWRNSGGIWRDVEPVSDVNPNADMFACAVAVDDGTVHVVWNGDITGSTYDRIFYRARTGAGWGTTEIVSTYGNGNQYDPVVSVSEGLIDVVWRGYTEISPARFEILCRQKQTGIWSDVMQLTNRSQTGLYYPALAVGAFDDLHIVWYDNSDGENDAYYIRGEIVDAGVASILAPSGEVNLGMPVTPMVVVRNYGNNSMDCWAYCFLLNPLGERVYSESLNVVSLASDAETTLVFPSFVVNDIGTWTVRCSTHTVLDKDKTNDVREGSFIVYSTDIEMFQIQAPSGTIDSGTVVTPRARWWNRGDYPSNFIAYLKMFNASGTMVYSDSLAINGLAGRQDTIVNFSPYLIGGVPGTWSVRCSTFCRNDTFPDNDVRSSEFIVRLIPHWPYGWHEVKQVPLGPSNKTVGDGGWITQKRVSGTRCLFVLKGNKVGEFYLYDPLADTWHQLASMPLGREGRPPRRASVGVAGGDYIYATKGNNTLGFWGYNVDLDTWVQMEDVPPGPLGKRVKAGTDIMYIKRPHTDTGYVYLLKGYTDEFYRFNTVSGHWETLAPAPLTASGRRWDRGSWIVYQARPGQNQFYIYAHKSKVHELWKYDVLADTWFSQPLVGMPFIGRLGKAKKCKDGSSGAWYNDGIYALKGGNTCEFWRYDVWGDSWVELDTMPSVGSTGKKKRVKGGGDIVLYEDGVFFALKGNKTPELWCYVVADTLFSQLPKEIGPAAGVQIGKRFLTVAPNPSRNNGLLLISGVEAGMKVQIVDVAGRVVFTPQVNGAMATVDLRLLPKGVYLLKAIGKSALTQKIVVE
ncbi:MAG: T9SS type A sorting domain-containing protein [bacterium]